MSKILTQNPQKRAKVSEIRKHDWFMTSTPVSDNKGIIVGYTQIKHEDLVLRELKSLQDA